MWYRRAQIGTEQKAAKSFYSHLQHVVESKMGGKMPARELMRLLTNAGVSAEEIRWSGLERYLEAHPVVIKSDLLSHLQRRLHNIAIHQVDYDEHDSEDGSPQEDEDYGKYALPGGDNYREFLISIGANADDPDFIDYIYEKYNHKYDKDLIRRMVESRPIGWQNEWIQYSKAIGEHFPEFISPHYPNYTSPIAHMRVTERKTKDGKRALHLEEVQSDWHQSGRHNGYYTPEEMDLILRYNRAVADPELHRIQLMHESSWSDSDKKRIREWNLLRRQYANVFSASENPRVPHGPHSKTWHELAMKHALDIAVREGYDRVTWNTGKINRGIFGLSKVVDKLEIIRTADDFLDIQGWKNDEVVIQKSGILPKDLDKYIGKDAAEKFFDSGRDEVVLENEDLEVGGRGMDGFYDKILPDFMRKYTKRWNADVNPVDVDTGRYQHYVSGPNSWRPNLKWTASKYGDPKSSSTFDTREEAERFREENKTESWAQVHGVDITPEMREEILTKGQRLATIARPLIRTGQGCEPE